MVEHAPGPTATSPRTCPSGGCCASPGWTGSPVYFVHVSCKEGLEAIREARAESMPVYGETLHNYCCFNADTYREENGMKYHTYPSLKSEEDRLALWDGIVRGGLNTMATDEYCTSWALKVAGRLVSDVVGGHNGAATRVGITYSEGVSQAGHVAAALRRRDVGQRRQDYGPLSPQGRHRPGQ